ncbi:SGNH/GDSL hydrolase family protein [Bryobacter aggregatus]|uniref:SGNH/GDSL hydrolase family protein n=1 Tax=Bryobacter aggregatus TaxID=360054 RepID=UPI0012BA9766|nr:SGNH/GDSL hydrolase family protein [Bryobacter aggregatus]
MRLATVFLVASFALMAEQEAATETPLRVLFLGNSYTYVNSLPDMVMALANSTPGRKIEAKSVTRGGSTLAELWSLTNGLEVLRSGTWDEVVLQDQSTLGINYANGKWIVNQPGGLLRWSRFWNTEIQRKGASPVLYLTWARKAYPEFQTALNYAYSEAARELNATIAPAGLAWKRIRETQPQFELFDPDGSHPSPTGTYLTACVFLETLVNRSCEGATRNFAGLKLTEADQHLLSDAAHYAVEQVRAGFLANLPRPDYSSLKPLPVGSGKPEDFQGIWHGTAMVHNAVQEMELNVSVAGKTCKGSITLSQVRNQIRLSYPLSNCTIDASTLIFMTSDPRMAVEEYRAILSEGKLVGTQALRSIDPYLRMHGTFELRKD